ncbi:hypothetical protein BJV77DRAFT_732105 [Russula vinacea]|nr:hypothetical protein BJV77DRAFT_732105 [Russula vinacea]
MGETDYGRVRKKRVLKVLNIDGVGEKPSGSLDLRHLAQLCTHKMTRGTPKSLALHHASPVHLMVNIKVPDPYTVEALTRAEWPRPVRYGFSRPFKLQASNTVLYKANLMTLVATYRGRAAVYDCHTCHAPLACLRSSDFSERKLIGRIPGAVQATMGIGVWVASWP